MPTHPARSLSALVFLSGLVLSSPALAPPAAAHPDPGQEPQGTDEETAPATARGERDEGPSPAVTEADRLYQVRAALVDAAPRLDGRLDDAAWRQATPLTRFVQAQPDEGAPVSEATEVYVVYDADSLYIGAMMYDSSPERIVATALRRDESHDDNDAFAITLDTYHDHRNGYFFETNPLGAKFDAQIMGEGGSNRFSSASSFNPDWDAVWEVAAAITPEGWSVEVRIPFWSLRFDPGDLDAWGINFRRAIRRNSEEAYWAPVPRQYNATRLSLSGMLLGLHSQTVARPRNLQVKPFALGDVTQLPAGPAASPLADHHTGASGDAGLDVKWAVTPNMTFDGTVNTDFAQVEADDVQVNLTRFPLFFPEKREFFLENAGLFSFGGGSFGSARVVGFHSRRIGIEDGAEVPILGGARLSGKAGPWSVGALSLQTEGLDELGLPSTNHGVLRLRRDLGSRSNVGVLFTNQQASGDEYNRELGFDGRWALSDTTTVDGWWMETYAPGTDEASWAGEAKVEWSTNTWQVDGALLEIGEGFDPGLGFVTRTGIRSADATVHWTPYPETELIRNHGPHASLNYTTDRDGRLLSRRLHLDWDTFLRRGDKISVAHNRNFEQLDLPFEIIPGVVIPVGAYHFDEVQVELQSDPSRAVNGRLVYTWGSFFDGDRGNLEAGAGFRLGARFATSVSWNRNDIDLPVGDFVTDLWRARVSYDFSTSLFLAGLFQYDNQTDQFLSNVRVNFIHTPGADLFLVYNERRLIEDPTLVDRAVILKATHLLRF